VRPDQPKPQQAQQQKQGQKPQQQPKAAQQQQQQQQKPRPQEERGPQQQQQKQANKPQQAAVAPQAQAQAQPQPQPQRVAEAQFEPAPAMPIPQAPVPSPAEQAAKPVEAMQTVAVADVAGEASPVGSEQAGESGGRRRRGRRGGRRRRRGGGEAAANAEIGHEEHDEAVDEDMTAAQRSQPEFDFEDEEPTAASVAAVASAMPASAAAVVEREPSQQSVVEAATADETAFVSPRSEDVEVAPPAAPEPVEASMTQPVTDEVEPGADVPGPHIDEVAVAANEVPAANPTGELEPVSLAAAETAAVGVAEAQDVGHAPGLFDGLPTPANGGTADPAEAAATAASQMANNPPTPEEHQGA
jgi:ribonuclease E